MKKFISTFLAVCTALTLASCGGTTTPPDETSPTPTQVEQQTATPEATPTPEQPDVPDTPTEAFAGKVGIVTNTIDQNEEEYRSAQQMVEKYGEDKIVHVTWPVNFMTEQEQMVSIVTKLGDDPEIKAIVANQAVPGCNAAFDKLAETRDDIFVVYCTPQEAPADVVERANLVLIPNELDMGPAMVQQAKKLGAKVFVHYSFPRHMSQVLLSGRRELIKQECAKLDIEFVDATAPDPTSEVGTTGAQQFILEDVPKMVAQYGKDTAFFSTNCAMQIPLIKSVVDEGAIYPQPCCPSPYHGFPTALGLDSGEGENMASIEDIVAQTKAVLAEKNMLGRVSTWPVPAAMMATVAGVEYAIKWINGEVPAERGELDVDVLKSLMADYAGISVELSAYHDEETGQTLPTFQMLLMDYLTYE